MFSIVVVVVVVVVVVPLQLGAFLPRSSFFNPKQTSQLVSQSSHSATQSTEEGEEERERKERGTTTLWRGIITYYVHCKPRQGEKEDSSERYLQSSA